MPTWRRCVAEAAGTALLVIAIVVGIVALEHPASQLHRALASAGARRACLGAGIGAVLAAIGASRIGRTSGAYLNPAITLGMLRAGKIRGRAAGGYMLAQVLGAYAGMVACWLVLGRWLSHPRIGYAVSAPAPDAHALAFGLEVAMSFVLMATILVTGRSRRLARYTSLLVGIGVTVAVWAAAPVSGVSLNPARTLGSALVARHWHALWIYLVAPPLGMYLAGTLCRPRSGLEPRRRGEQ